MDPLDVFTVFDTRNEVIISVHSDKSFAKAALQKLIASKVVGYTDDRYVVWNLKQVCYQLSSPFKQETIDTYPDTDSVRID